MREEPKASLGVRLFCVGLAIAMAIPLGLNSTIGRDNTPIPKPYSLPYNPGLPYMPGLPYINWGIAYLDGQEVTAYCTINSLVNDTRFGWWFTDNTGYYELDTWWDLLTEEVREGAWNGDIVYFLLPFTNWYYFAPITATWMYCGYDNLDLHFSTDDRLPALKISSLTPNPTKGNDMITIYNPTGTMVDLQDWKLRDRDGWEKLLDGRIIMPHSRIAIDLGGNILSNAAEGGPTAGDEMSLCWHDIDGIVANGMWVSVDLVEYGNQNLSYGFDERFKIDNTSMGDFPTTPSPGYRMSRSPFPYTDTENCTNDFIMEEAPSSVELESGWNLVSVPLIQENCSVESALSSINGKYERVLAYDSNDKLDPWKSYRPGGTANDLEYIDHTMGIWILSSTVCYLQPLGTAPETTTIGLTAGWNLVGYPSGTERPINDALAGTGFDRPVECMDNTSPGLLRQMNSNENIIPGCGYWVHVPADTIWTVTWS